MSLKPNYKAISNEERRELESKPRGSGTIKISGAANPKMTKLKDPRMPTSF